MFAFIGAFCAQIRVIMGVKAGKNKEKSTFLKKKREMFWRLEKKRYLCNRIQERSS